MAAASPSLAIQELCRGLQLDEAILKEFAESFTEDLKKGLEGKEEENSMECILSFVKELPTGSERGQFLALEFSGVEIKVAFVKLRESSFDMRAKQYTISEELRKGSGIKLFEFLAQSVCDFCSINRLNDLHLKMGFSFGFPYEQRNVKSGYLIRWTKEFSCSGVIGKDVVVLLEKAIAKKPVSVTVIAIINNAIGTLFSCVWKKRACRMGFVADWGTNLAYLDKAKNIPKCKETTEAVVITTECGNFGACGEINFLRTGWDKELDNESLCPGEQTLEKMVSPLYLSELVRRILITAVQRSIILKGKISHNLATIDSLPNRLIFDLMQDAVGQRGARTAFISIGYPTPCAQDCADLEYVCTTVTTRATHLMGAVFGGVMNHLRYKEVLVGMEGAFLRWLPSAPENIKDKVMQLNPHTKAAMTAP